MVSMKNVLRRFLSMALAVVLVFSLVPAFSLSAYAASSGTLTGLADTSIGASYTASTDDTTYASWSVQSGTEILGSAAYKSSSCGGNDHNTTLTLTNNKKETAVLSFTYTLTSSGTVQVDGTNVTTGSTFSKELAAGESVKIYVASNGSGTSAKITMTNITLLVNRTATATFKPAENGSYTVDGKTITETYSNTQSSLTAYSVKATPNDGYKFVGWYSVTDESFLKTDATTTFNFDSDKTITAVFTESGNQVYSVGTKMFYDLDDATKYAVDNSIEKVALVQNGKSITGTHTIPSGVTLLIPFDSMATLYKDVPAATSGGSASNKNNAYRTLTLAEGAVLNIEGGLSVGGSYKSAAGSAPGYMTGNYGLLSLSDGSSINVKNGGSLYAWGFVVGSGSVTAESGSTVWEWFQIDDFRGGTATMGMGNGVFPFSQYFIQNIEAPLTIQAGAKENVYTGVYASSKINNASIEFIGDGGMFKLNSGSITRTYDGSTDRVTYTVSGDIELNSLSLNLGGSNVNSAKYVLPITNNISISVASGKATINQDLSLLAGVELSIAKGADMTVASGKSIYVYDADEWNAASYTCVGKFASLPFVYSRTYTRAASDLVDAKIDVNGILTVAGYVYTTAGGANICSSEGTGQYIQQAAPGTTTTTYQYTQSGSKVSRADIPVTAAKLHNADGSYTETKDAEVGDTYVYANGNWALKGNEITITFDANGGTGKMAALMANPGYDKQLSSNTFTREGYTFTGWNTKADGTGANYADGATVKFDVDTTLYAQWTQKPVITFNVNGGEGTMSAQTVNPNESAALPANTFTRADYDFAGWNTKADGSGMAYADKENITTNENVTLYAQWVLHQYHVRWLNWNGTTVLQEGDYTCEEYAYYDFEHHTTPTKPEDENYTYKFANRWTPYDETNEIDGMGFYPHADINFKAEFTKYKKLTVTFDANGGYGIMDTVRIANGYSGKSYMLPKCGFTREGYVFDGWLITGTVSDWGKEVELKNEPWTEPKLFALSDLTLKASWKHSNGWFTDDNGKQYYKDGELQKTGWTTIGEDVYYLDPTTGYAATGVYQAPYPDSSIGTYGPNENDLIYHEEEYKAAGYETKSYFLFDENGVFQKDFTGMYTKSDGTVCWIANGELSWHGCLVTDGKVYCYVSAGGSLHEEGVYWIGDTNNLLDKGYYYFKDYKIQKDTTGFVSSNGSKYYVINGRADTKKGLFELDGSYYYVKSNYTIVCGTSYYVSNTNSLMPAGTYTFDADGKMVIETPSTKNGLIKENGDLYYYVDGVKTHRGLIQVDGAYYYINSSCKAVKDCDYYVSNTNGLMTKGTYHFGSDGKMVIKYGLVEENGEFYYYVDGVKTHAGLILINGAYYYINSSGKAVTGEYYVSNTNGLMDKGWYEFDADGKMVQH